MFMREEEQTEDIMEYDEYTTMNIWMTTRDVQRSFVVVVVFRSFVLFF
jgi:hypothetical protein